MSAALVWVIFALLVLALFYKQFKRLLEALVRRIEGGDEVKISTWITLGHSAGPLKIPPPQGTVTDDHLSLIHRSWRVTNRDQEFGGQQMYQIHVILYGEKPALERVDYVLYKLDPSYPNPTRASSDRQNMFELKELANGYSLLRAEIKIKGQEQIIYLSRFIDLTNEAPKLRDTYFQ
jgi:hypothetical protein